MNPRERFLDAAVEPLADNAELQLAARQRLEAGLSPTASDEDLNDAASRLERGGNGRWRWIWAAVVVGLSIVLVFQPMRKLVSGWLMARQLMTPLMMLAPEPRLSFRDSLSSEDRLLLFGDETLPGGANRWLPLWEAEPENPMFYIEHALAFASKHGEPPKHFLETGERLDPGNGWFALKAAATGAGEVVERARQNSRDRKAGVKLTERTAHDDAELARRIALLKQGAMAERIESYQGRLRELRFSKLPRPREFTEFIPVVAYMAGMTIDMDARHVVDLIEVEAQRCEWEWDPDGFRELTMVWERFFEGSLDEAHTLVECLLVNAGLGATLPAMSDAASSLEIDADLWKDRADQWQARKDQLKSRSDAELEERVTRHGSMMTALSLPMISRQVMQTPPVTKADLLPATRVEQALIGRMMAGAGWLLLGLLGLGSLLAGRAQAPLTRRMSIGFGRIFEHRKVLLIGAAGVLAPLAIYLILRYATPLGRLDWGPRLTMYAVPLSHFIGLLLMWIVWPVALADWAAARNLGILRWKRPGWWTWSAMIAPIAGMLCFSFAVPPGSSSVGLGLAGIVFGAWSLIWFLVRGWRGAFGRLESRLMCGTVAGAMRPAWLGAMLLMAGLVVFFHAEERRWFARDDLMRVGPSFTAYEAKVTEQLKRELREVME